LRAYLYVIAVCACVLLKIFDLTTTLCLISSSSWSSYYYFICMWHEYMYNVFGSRSYTFSSFYKICYQPRLFYVLGYICVIHLVILCVCVSSMEGMWLIGVTLTIYICIIIIDKTHVRTHKSCCIFRLYLLSWCQFLCV
jgi:hypothetical protein